MAATDTAKQERKALKVTLSQIEEYLREHATSDRSAPLKGLPFAKGEQVFLTAKHFGAHALKGVEGANRQTISKALRDLGFALIQYPHKKRDGKVTAPAYWRLDRKVSGVAQMDEPEKSSSGEGNGSRPQEDSGGK